MASSPGPGVTPWPVNSSRIRSRCGPRWPISVAEVFQRALDILGRVRLQRLGEVVGDAHVVDDVAALLAVGGPVHPGDRLQQFRFPHRPVQVQHLLDRGVEPGQQHRLDDEERGWLPPRGQLVRIRERLEEVVVNEVLLLARVGPGRVAFLVVRGSGGDDRDEVDRPQQVQVPGGADQERGPPVQAFRVGAAGGRGQLLDLGDQLVAGVDQGVPVPQRGAAAVRDELGLEPLRQHRLDVVPEHVLRLGGDQLLRLHHVALGGVLALDLLPFLVGVVGEHVLEDLVQVAAVAHRALDRAADVQDRHDRPVAFGVGQPVDVDVVAEDVGGLLLRAHDDRRAGEPDPGAVRQATPAGSRAASSCATGAPRRSAPRSTHRCSARRARAYASSMSSLSRLFRAATSCCFWIITNTTPGP